MGEGRSFVTPTPSPTVPRSSRFTRFTRSRRGSATRGAERVRRGKREQERKRVSDVTEERGVSHSYSLLPSLTRFPHHIRSLSFTTRRRPGAKPP